MFQKFRFYERYRQVRTVDGNILAQFQQVGHRSDVILMSVGQHHAHHVVHPVLNIGEIRQNQVHPGLNLFGKQHPAIHNQDFAFGFQTVMLRPTSPRPPKGTTRKTSGWAGPGCGS